MNLPFHTLDEKNERLKTLAVKNKTIWNDLGKRVDLSWIFHDHGLEGTVLQSQEMNEALNDKVASDSSFLPMFQEIRNMREVIGEVRELGRGRRKKEGIDGELMCELYQAISHNLRGVDPEGDGLRREDGRYATYYHRFCSHEDLQKKLDELVDLANEDVLDVMHPVNHAALFHLRFMKAMPFGRFSGKIGRLLTNVLLLRYDYLPCVIHTVERARYYESLTYSDEERLCELMIEALRSGTDGGIRFFEEVVAERKRKRQARKRMRSQAESGRAT